MSTTSTVSELRLSELACKGLAKHAKARVLVGGLGLGFSLRRVLDFCGADATVEVAELLPEVVAWNREFLGAVNGALLDDPRVKIFVGDVFEPLRRAGNGHYDAILLDVDNGPTSFVQAKNARIYNRRGIGLIHQVLKPGGKVAFWSACEEPDFMASLAFARFKVDAFPTKSHERAKRFEHVIYVGERLD